MVTLAKNNGKSYYNSKFLRNDKSKGQAKRPGFTELWGFLIDCHLRG